MFSQTSWEISHPTIVGIRNDCALGGQNKINNQHKQKCYNNTNQLMKHKLNKNRIYYVASILTIAIIVVVGIVYLIRKPESAAAWPLALRAIGPEGSTTTYFNFMSYYIYC